MDNSLFQNFFMDILLQLGHPDLINLDYFVKHLKKFHVDPHPLIFALTLKSHEPILKLNHFFPE